MNILNVIFPKQCIICSRIGTLMCSTCIKALQKTLPTCCICSKVNNQYLTHRRCSQNHPTHSYTGWYLNSRLESFFSMYIENSIYSPYIDLLIELVKEKKIEDLLLNSMILPMGSKRVKENHINLYLSKFLSKRFKNASKKKILLVGAVRFVPKVQYTDYGNNIEELNTLSIFQKP